MPDWHLPPKRLLTISPEETKFARRGFRACDSVVQKRLETAGEVFLYGYHAALDCAEQTRLAERLHSVDGEFRGFAFEGAGMSLELQDCLSVFGSGNRFDSFLAGPGAPHAYMLHVGAGWAFARLLWLRWSIGRAVKSLDPLLRWLAVDGFGFHEGYFHSAAAIGARRIPFNLQGYFLRAFDQGLGRSLWFVNGAAPDRIAGTIATFEEERRADLWSGVGLACAYAGGISESGITRLAVSAASYGPELAQGVAFAAKARQRAGNPSPFTELACRLVCGMNASTAAAITDQALVGLPLDGPEPTYELWRRSIQRKLQSEIVSRQGILQESLESFV